PPSRSASCFVCSETFRDPVSLSCNHSFCSSCLQKFWKQANNRNCPVCKRRSSKDIVVNFGLKQLADSFKKERRRCRWCAANIRKSLNCSVKTSRELCVLSVTFLSTRVTKWFL
uniref:RING-type domain-containing protein n=1 Tax=Nothobranchius furzeri TaxID=105023 RepID=A0A8C6LLQ1_NOTFU